MRIANTNLFEHFRKEGGDKPLDPFVIRLLTYLQLTFKNVWLALNGNLSFGTSAAADNISGKWMLYTTNGVAGTEDAVVHNLGVIPTGFILMIPPQAGVINRGPTAWTTTTIYLSCSAATQTATIFILIPPRT